MHSVLIVGGGQMAQALLRAWIPQKLLATVTVVEPSPSDTLKALGVTCVPEPATLADQRFDRVVFAVKPQILPQIAAAYADRLTSGGYFLSIAAGKTLDFFAKHLGADAPVIRVMPNTPAMIAQGVSVLVANNPVTVTQRATAQTLFAAVGDTHWLEDEKLMHAVTAVSGSGPAYVFALIEALAAAGEKNGLSPDMAAQLARQTIQGAAALAVSQPTITPAQLRQNVTSPGGTTAAALAVLQGEEGLDALMQRAVTAAAQRSVALSSE